MTPISNQKTPILEATTMFEGFTKFITEAQIIKIIVAGKTQYKIAFF
ncbi:hypothetical protein OFO01_07640 [Campylobacter sp. JMF_01 NE2]|nr:MULTISPECIES: hypothetical protein [unclassified Campylobacter]MDA3053325.1 hypothetical protein [Campylobacter sp. JMF_03 NE3]MDA3067655.1 hypothetical protein [Campylobacter sp. JMF_01 NE2]